MTNTELQRFLEQARVRSRMTDQQWGEAEVEVQVERNAKAEDLRFNVNISDKCVDRVQVWASRE